MVGHDDLPAVVPTAQFFRALAAQLPTQVEVDLFIADGTYRIASIELKQSDG